MRNDIIITASGLHFISVSKGIYKNTSNLMCRVSTHEFLDDKLKNMHRDSDLVCRRHSNKNKTKNYIRHEPLRRNCPENSFLCQGSTIMRGQVWQPQHPWHCSSLGQRTGPSSMCTLYWHYWLLCVIGTKNNPCPPGTALVSHSVITANWERELSSMSNWLDIKPCVCWSKAW